MRNRNKAVLPFQHMRKGLYHGTGFRGSTPELYAITHYVQSSANRAPCFHQIMTRASDTKTVEKHSPRWSNVVSLQKFCMTNLRKYVFLLIRPALPNSQFSKFNTIYRHFSILKNVWDKVRGDGEKWISIWATPKSWQIREANRQRN